MRNLKRTVRNHYFLFNNVNFKLENIHLIEYNYIFVKSLPCITENLTLVMPYFGLKSNMFSTKHRQLLSFNFSII